MISRLAKGFVGKRASISEPTPKSLNITALKKGNNHHQSPYITSTLQTLDDDSIYLILVALCYTDVTRRLKQLWPLSLTSKRLRELCLPLMFKRVMWPNKRIPNIEDDVPMLPETLWPYIQYVCTTSKHLEKVVDPSDFIRNFRLHYNDDDYNIDELIDAIPKLTGLSTFSIHSLTTPPVMLIDALFRCPSLVDLSFEETPLDFRPPLTHCESLHTLRFRDGRDLRVNGSPSLFIRSWWESPGRKIYKQIEFQRRDLDKAATADILSVHSPFLRHVELASGLTPVCGLADMAWPKLQKLVLTGPCPSLGEPILPMIQSMPALRDLQILYSRCPPQHGPPYWFVCPPNTITGNDNSPTSTLETCSPLLHSLTLSNPHPADMVFRSIPRSLESLTLLSIYEWPHQTKGIDHTFATKVVREVSVCGARLHELRMCVNKEPSVGLVDTIVRSFPGLKTLHLGVDTWPRPAQPGIDTRHWVSNPSDFRENASSYNLRRNVMPMLYFLFLLFVSCISDSCCRNL